MKTSILILISLFFSLSLLAQMPLVKFYMQDGSTKRYNLEDVDSKRIMDKIKYRSNIKL